MKPLVASLVAITFLVIGSPFVPGAGQAFAQDKKDEMKKEEMKKEQKKAAAKPKADKSSDKAEPKKKKKKAKERKQVSVTPELRSILINFPNETRVMLIA